MFIAKFNNSKIHKQFSEEQKLAAKMEHDYNKITNNFSQESNLSPIVLVIINM